MNKNIKPVKATINFTIFEIFNRVRLPSGLFNTKTMKLKIYEFEFSRGVKDLVIAESKPNAIKMHQSESGMHIDDFKEVKIRRILKKNWDKYTYWEEDPSDTITFKEFMTDRAYCERWFCSTEY